MPGENRLRGKIDPAEQGEDNPTPIQCEGQKKGTELPTQCTPASAGATGMREANFPPIHPTHSGEISVPTATTEPQEQKKPAPASSKSLQDFPLNLEAAEPGS